jgi:serine/threonine protein kinase/Flp pilus assembly protein TadD
MKGDTGARLGHYEIVGSLGKGGMGEVYLAQDTRLDRRVALKILPNGSSADHERLTRFIREAKAASALNHPNIITVYDIGESAGTHFIAYEFIEGRTLREFANSRPLSVAATLEIGTQIASALVEAHGAGIVHRDLKPDNVMIRTSGLVKLLDFGIARLTRPVETPETDGTVTSLNDRTQDGALIGTPQFMSPEQARGTEVNHQTDIFSFGAILYELLSGQSPFAAGTVADVLAAVLTHDPPRLTGVPPKLADVVSKAMQKDRSRRYETAAALLHDLARIDARSKDPGLPSAASAREVRSVAVLPFANMSTDEENEHFCDGLAEELLNALSKIDALKVAARTSAFSFKGKHADVSTIARTLGVNTIVEGSVRRAGRRLRISVQLINAADGYQLWSERYDREMGDVFALQDDITLAVVHALKLRLLGDERATVLKRYTDNVEAYELFLKGRYHSQKYTPQGWNQSIEFFEKAIALEPDYALAYAGLAASRTCLWYFGLLPAEDTIPESKAATERALVIDDSLADAHLSRGLITFFYDWDAKQAEPMLKKSIALNPDNAEALSYYAMFLAVLGRVEEAIALTGRALRLDPLAPLVGMNCGWTYFSAGMSAEASEWAEKMIETEPAFFGARWLKGAIHLSEGEFESAVMELRTAVSLGGHPVVLADLGSACSLAGKTDEADAILRQLLEMRRERYVPATCLARVYARSGDIENAIKWFETAWAERNGEMVFLREEIASATDADPLRRLADEPRVTTLLGRMNLLSESGPSTGD